MTTLPCNGLCKTGSCKEVVGAGCLVGMYFRSAVPELVFITPVLQDDMASSVFYKTGSCREAVGADCFLGMVFRLAVPGLVFIAPPTP